MLVIKMADEIVGLPKLKVDDLKKELQKRGLRTKGTKAELQERLLDSLKNEVTQDSNEEKNDVENDEESNENNDLGISTEEDEIEIITSQELDSTLDVKTDTEAKEIDATSKTTTEIKPAEPLKATVKITMATSETEKRSERAKRFGEVTNETDKKKMRTERFKYSGDSAAVVFKGKPISGDEMNKLKKRAERFGVIAPVLEKLGENDKKVKRQERFGLITSVSTAPSGSNLDARKQKRAERFGL